MAIQNSDFASGASDSICDTPPSAKSVIARTFRPRDFASNECASSCSRSVTKNNTPVMMATDHTVVLPHCGMTVLKRSISDSVMRKAMINQL